MNAAAAQVPGLRDSYARELHAHGYQADNAQIAAIERLDALRAQLGSQPSPGAVARWLRRLRSAAPRPGAAHAPGGLYLWGAVGRGKTWLMDLFYDSLGDRTRQRSHFHHFMRDIHASLQQLRARRDPLELVARQLAARASVLCLDELYVSDIADAMILGTLFEALLGLGTTLVITSNVPPSLLYRDGLQRSRFLPAIALLERELDVFCLDGGVDYRLRHLQRRPIYLDSARPDTPAQLRRLFDEIAGEHGDSSLQLQVQGRRLRTVQRRGPVVWFAFSVLCEGPRSQNDYVELAQEFNTLVLSDVPILHLPQQDDAARRLIALIDELYDQGVKLIVSAAAPPDQLYRGERLQQEFHRTASRLVEMQSEAYLARAHRV
ncbi:MAG: cell division protein ZapE [Steroidobacteraceae bacterium]